MTDTSGPFAGASWAEADWYRFAPRWVQDGVYSVSDLTITTSALTVTLATGRAWVHGAGFERTGTPASNSVTVNTNSTNYRRDRIVLRRSLTSHTVTPTVLVGSPSATPAPPALTQNETTDWDIPLHSFLVPPASGTVLTGFIDERRVLGNTPRAMTLSGFNAFGGRAPGYYMDHNGLVHLEGAITSVSAFTAPSGVFFILPPAYAPPIDMDFPINTNSTYYIASLHIATTGEMWINQANGAPNFAGAAWVLDGTVFRGTG